MNFLTVLRWPLLSAVGLALGFGLGLLLASPAESLLGVMFVLPVVGAAAGLSLGGAQLLTGLQDHERPILWLVVTAAGVSAGLTLGTVLVEVVLVDIAGLRGGRILPDLVALLLVGSLTGGAAGLAQWMLLRRKTEESGAGWVAGSALGLAAGAVVGGAVSNLALGTIRSVPAILVIALAAGGAMGAVLGRRWRDGEGEP